MSAAIIATIARLARAELGLDVELRSDQRLVEDLELDSIRLLTLATAVEDHFRICLDEADEEAIVTVGDLAATITRKLRAEDAGAAGTADAARAGDVSPAGDAR